MLSIMDIAAVLLTLSAVFGWLNHKFLPLSHSVGLLVTSVVTSLILIGLDALFPGLRLLDQLSSGLQQIDFTEIVVNGMLGFLLFAGSLHVDLETLRSRAFPVFLLAVFGTIISTGVVGVLFWASPAWRASPFRSRGRVFGALISPTDPVAVLSTLRNANVPKDLQVETEGEALFNDGVGIFWSVELIRTIHSEVLFCAERRQEARGRRLISLFASGPYARRTQAVMRRMRPEILDSASAEDTRAGPGWRWHSWGVQPWSRPPFLQLGMRRPQHSLNALLRR